MILRKPYAFLIKHFRLIHIVMFFIMGYLVFPLRKLYFFFKDYAMNNNFTYTEGIAKTYISSSMFFFCILIFAFAISIFFLMHKKEKPVFFYRILALYSLLLLALLIYL